MSVTTGRQWELDFFGFTKSRIPKRSRRSTKREFKKAMTDLQRTKYGWDPKNPHTPFASALFQQVKLALILKEQDPSELGLYCTLDSPLDMRGIDGFFEYNGNIVTFDLTTNISKFNFGVHLIINRRDFWRTSTNNAYRIAQILLNSKESYRLRDEEEEKEEQPQQT